MKKNNSQPTKRLIAPMMDGIIQVTVKDTHRPASTSFKLVSSRKFALWTLDRVSNAPNTVAVNSS